MRNRVFLLWLLLLFCACSGGDDRAQDRKAAVSRSGGDLEGTVIFLDRPFPPGSKMTAVLDRALPAPSGPAKWETIDQVEMPIGAPPLTFTLHYDPNRVEGRRFRVRVWGEDPGGTLLLAARAQSVELPAANPLAMMLRYVGEP